MESKSKNPHAQILSRFRWDKSPKAERTEIARKAAFKRWDGVDHETRKNATLAARMAKLAKKRQK